MTKKEKLKTKKVFGLLGKNISYSFSSGYFKEKFIDLNLDDHEYHNFDVESLEELSIILKLKQKELKGLNVTIPYKEKILKYLDSVDPTAKKIGAVNTIKFTKKGSLKGYNTDVYGFRKSLKPLLNSSHKQALILGTGGASKSIAYVFDKLKIPFLFVSRNPEDKNEISYEAVNEQTLREYQIIVNCTPVGTFPETKRFPNLPYAFLNHEHLLYDLIYNPSETAFLAKGKESGSQIKNGLEMLQLQAEKSWEIWNR